MKSLTRIICIAVALMMAIVAMANESAATRAIVPMDLSFANPCTGELMQTYGSVLILSREKTDRNGTQYFVFKILMHNLFAIGLDTQLRYKAVGINSGTLYVQKTDDTGTYMFASRFGYVSQSSEPNWFQTEVFKITINGNGEVAVVRSMPSTLECR